MKNYFNEDVTRTCEQIELYEFLKKHFQFCEVGYINDTERNVGIKFNGDRYYIKYSNGYTIFSLHMWNSTDFASSLSDLKLSLIEIFGMKYNLLLNEYRTKKLNKILNGQR